MEQRPVNVIVYRYLIWLINCVKDLGETGGALREQGFSMIFFYTTGTRTPGKQEIISMRHMWPLTPVPPSTRAGYAVTFADKMCCLEETKATVKRYAAVPGHLLFAQTAERGKF